MQPHIADGSPPGRSSGAAIFLKNNWPRMRGHVDSVPRGAGHILGLLEVLPRWPEARSPLSPPAHQGKLGREIRLGHIF